MSHQDVSIGLITLNAKFIHSSLSLRYLRNSAQRAGYSKVWIEEFVIHQPLWKIAAAIQNKRPKVLGISIYIWNRGPSFQLIEQLKKQDPQLQIVIGGPEVSFEEEYPPHCTVIAGEGESKWVECLAYLTQDLTPPEEELQRWNTYGVDLPDLYPAYRDEDFSQLEHRFAYLETSRGCPYLCSFCLSALDKKVRYFDDQAVRDQIQKLVRSNVRAIKFVDRTFNLQTKRVLALLDWLTQFNETSFHFEVVGDLLTPEILDFLDTVPEGLFQFEIGIQTVTESIQNEIERKQNNDKLFANLRRLVEQNRIHIHADLIFGLPGETLEQMLDSFSQVVSLRPHELQLGFLKFLPGAPIRKSIKSHSYLFQSFPPYELISNKDASAGDILYLKKFDEVFDLFYNSKRFLFSLDYLFREQPSLDVFQKLLVYMEDHNLLSVSLSLDARYKIFFDAFGLAGSEIQTDLLKLDYLYHQQVFHLPHFLQEGLRKKGFTRFKAWTGDRKTPMVPFLHRIGINGASVRLTPTDEPVYYAVVHPKKSKGYFHRPTLQGGSHQPE